MSRADFCSASYGGPLAEGAIPQILDPTVQTGMALVEDGRPEAEGERTFAGWLGFLRNSSQQHPLLNVRVSHRFGSPQFQPLSLSEEFLKGEYRFPSGHRAFMNSAVNGQFYLPVPQRRPQTWTKPCGRKSKTCAN